MLQNWANQVSTYLNALYSNLQYHFFFLNVYIDIYNATDFLYWYSYIYIWKTRLSFRYFNLVENTKIWINCSNFCCLSHFGHLGYYNEWNVFSIKFLDKANMVKNMDFGQISHNLDSSQCTTTYLKSGKKSN